MILEQVFQKINKVLHDRFRVDTCMIILQRFCTRPFTWFRYTVFDGYSTIAQGDKFLNKRLLDLEEPYLRRMSRRFKQINKVWSDHSFPNDSSAASMLSYIGMFCR